DTSRQTKNLNKLLIRILLHLQVEFSGIKRHVVLDNFFSRNGNYSQHSRQQSVRFPDENSALLF
ncbi:hypothetical protein RIU45_09040, partial [Riemerella anatipestifer]|uniref:hypothetical protein n=1 Tax=Riemerella anatipestifer TaxID=34085 RepID=UPI00286270A2